MINCARAQILENAVLHLLPRQGSGQVATSDTGLARLGWAFDPGDLPSPVPAAP